MSIYLKPFEISVKDGDAHAVMVSWSFIGIKWSGENSNLLNNVLRGEWGFEGFSLTDFFRNNGHGFMNADAAVGVILIGLGALVWRRYRKEQGRRSIK